MIQAFTGFPGSGKTFACTYMAHKALKAGDRVFTNYPIKGAYKITFDDLVQFAIPEGSTVIIDESGRWFNSRNWSKLPPEIFDLFTLHRHFKLDLIVAVQNFNRIDIALREVIELVWWARNVPGFPWFIYDGYFDVESLGMKGESDKKMYVPKWHKARKLYDTHSMKSQNDSKNEMPLILWNEQEATDQERLSLAQRIGTNIKRMVESGRSRQEKKSSGND